MCVLEKSYKGLAQIHVFFMTVALLGAKFCLGPCTDVFPAMQRGGRVLIPHKHCLLLLNMSSLCRLRVEESLMLPGIKSQF